MSAQPHSRRRMSNVSVGGGGKTLNKLKRGNKRDGTPDKPTTPNASQDALQEEGDDAKKQVIVNDEILAMQIKPDDLQKLRDPRPPSGEKKRTPTPKSVVVRKLKPASEWDKPKPKIVTVAKAAPHDAPLEPVDYTGSAGPRFDTDGAIIPHSILGSIEDYKTQAMATGDFPAEFLTQKEKTMEANTLTLKYEKKPKVSQYPKFKNVEESNALKNWQQKMLERKKQQGYLSKLLNKPADQLVMNQSDNYRQTQELRYLIDRTIPTMDYGKGYRIGSEFWKQQERIGDDMTGIHMTMTQTEKGYPPPVEHVSVPPVALKEKGTDWDRPRTPFHKPWHKTPYLQERKKQLQPVMNELDPHQPDSSGLQIVGRNRPYGGNDEVQSETGMSEKAEQRDEFNELEVENMDPLREHPDVHPEPIFGPSIQFAGQPARWTGDSSTFSGQVGIEARVTFEAYSGHRTTSFLEIINDGTTSIYYDWKKVPKTNPFDLVNAKVQRFYFNTSSGVVLPGDTMKFPFVFKSPNAGVFTEQWQFQTRPVVCGGAALVVTLRGIALQQDKFKEQRTELETELARKQTEQIVSKILDDLLEGIRSPERPGSPVDAYITEEELFLGKNQGLHYHNELVTQLKTLYLELFPEEEREEQEWDLSIENMKEMIMSMDEEEDRKQEILERLNTHVFNLGFPPFTPKQQEMHNVGYEMLVEAVDRIVGESMRLREALGMPEMEGGDIPDDPSDSKKGGAKGKPDPKDKKGGKDAKGAAKGKEPAKGGKVTPGKRPVTRDDKTRASSPGAASGSQSPAPSTGDPILEGKFREKLYTQSYIIISEVLDGMDEVFGAIQDREGGPKLPVLS